ncbi:MAG: TlpA disulfide reductase family protein [Chitinophagaceae bacterium]
MKKLWIAVFIFFTTAVYAQKNFTYTPEKPKPGDIITFTYEPAGDIANTILPVEAVVYQSGVKGQKADDVMLKKTANKISGAIITDTAMNFLYLGFSSDKKFDNNFNEGYFIQLYENGEVRKGSYFNKAMFYQYYIGEVGGERNNEKALASMEKEISLFPESKKLYLSSYMRLLTAVKKDEGLALIQKEIESQLKSGLKDETDYNNLENLYSIAKLNEQSKFVTALKKEKFPDGNWTVSDALEKYSAEKDIEKKKSLITEIEKKVKSGNEKWQYVKDNLSYYQLRIPYAYVTAKKWEEVKKSVAELGISDKARIASTYNDIAWQMQEKSENLVVAEELSGIATTRAKEEWKNPAGAKPDYLTKKQWDKNRESLYARYADTYGMVLYRMGEYKKGLSFAKESALLINKGKDADQNNTYALLAEKTLPVKQYKKELEQFLKDGKSTSEMKGILKRVYVREKKSENGFDEYVTGLQKESYLKMLEELRKSMLNETAPSFALLDLSGNKVDIANLKGKVVVVDFWATWCGPCKASFPGMQKMVNKYSENPDVKFIFVDTWERGETKEKNAGDFITSNKYSFHVLMDNDDKVVTDYKVDGIPTKFVIDKEGKIRFKAIGFDGSDDKLMSELTAMIDMASDPSKKAF